MALENLRIIRFEAENVKKLRAVEITPSGELVEIIGKNGQGKTSVLDSILWALGGEKPIQWKPIREGEDSAFIHLDLGNEEGLQLQVTRTFRAQEGGQFSTSLKVTTPDGMRPRGEQTLLNTIVGALSFDPSAFVRADPQKQVALLKGLIPGVDFDEIARKRKAAFDERTDVNREAKRLRAAAESVVVGDDVPSEPIDVSALQEKIRGASAAAQAHAAEIARRDRMMRAIEDAQGAIEDGDSRIEELERQIAALRAVRVDLIASVDQKLKEYAALPPLEEPADSSALGEELSRALEINRQVERRQERDRLREQTIEQTEKAEALTRKIDALDEEVKDAVERANLPVRGLELRDDMVFLRGVPFDQASDAEQLRASMALGMAANPRLRVLRIRDGSLLDEDALEVIREVATEECFQIWMERVGTHGGPEAIIMENGSIKNG